MNRNNCEQTNCQHDTSNSGHGLVLVVVLYILLVVIISSLSSC